MYSFDIFDTLITRTTASPRGIFAIMQERLQKEKIAGIPSLIENNFYQIRAQGEETARLMLLNASCQDVTLEEIYGVIRENYQLTDEIIHRLIQLELDTEYDNIMPVTENINKVKQLYENKESVILISDMYLSQEQIRKLLVKTDSVFQEIKIYVSSEYKRTKCSGQLYQLVRQQEGADWKQWEHTGDNAYSDVTVPTGLGIKSCRFSVESDCSWLKQLMPEYGNHVGWQLMAGAVQRALIQKDSSYSYMVGAGYSAPILFPYMSWVIEQSISQGIQILYFIARDGYVLKKIADLIISAKGLSIETRYLYGSRKAWRLPSIKAEDFDMQYFIKWNYPRLISSFQKIADIMGMTIEELAAFFPFSIDENMRLGDGMKEEIFRILTAQQDVIAKFIGEKHKENRLHAIAYLQQELSDVNTKKAAFVELIGSGYSQKCLAKLVEDWFPLPLVTFYFRLDDINNSQNNINYAYFPNRLPYGNIIEILCPANHGQTLDYHKVNGKWEPILGEDEGQLLDAYGFQDYVEGIRSYTKEALKVPAGYEPMFRNLQIPARLFKVLENREDADLYDYIADMPYGIRGVERKVTSFIPKLTNRDLRKLYIYHYGEPVYQYYSGYEINYSLKRLTEKQKSKMEQYKKVGRWKIVRRINSFLMSQKHQRVCNSKYDLIARKVIIYGAGKKGKMLYKQLTGKSGYHADVVLWVDADYEKYQREGFPVESPVKISGVEYDQVIIAVAKKELAEEMKDKLVGLGVSVHRILWICPNNMQK